MSAFTFKKSLIIGLSATLACACVLAWSVFRVQEETHAEYAALLGEANPGKAAKTTPYTAQQHRKGVQKELFYTRNGQRLQLRLTSKEAIMVLEHQPEGNFLIEKMNDVKCWMQEELSVSEGRPYQVLRYLEADTATYSYKNDEVVASDVKIYRYTLPGHELPKHFGGVKPSMKGHAEAVQFSMAGKEVQFKAQKLKASLDGGTL